MKNDLNAGIDGDIDMHATLVRDLSVQMCDGSLAIAKSAGQQTANHSWSIWQR